MRAIILAAGRGSRLKSYTQDKPKCLIELGGRTLLEWQLSALKEGGVKDIVIVAGYRKELLKGSGYIVIDNPRWQEANMVVTLCCARDYLLGEECIVSYSDILYHPNVVRALRGAGGDVTITYDRLWRQLWQERFSDPLRDAETFKIDASGFICEIGKKATSLAQIHGQYMGLLKFTPAGWGGIERLLRNINQDKIDRLDMTSLLQLLIERGKKINAVAIDGKWCEVDSEGDLRLYERKIKDKNQGKQTWHHDWRWQ